MNSPTKISILGAGSWGTAFAIHLAKAGLDVTLWGHKPEHIKRLNQDRENQQFLPGAPFPDNLTVSNNLQETYTKATYPIIAVPSHAFSEIIQKLPKPIHHIAWLTKGLEPTHSRLLSDVVLEHSPKAHLAIMQGPSFAKELAEGLPTAITLAHNYLPFGEKLHAIIHTPPLRVYLSEDIIGVQLAGAVKNVLAIAVGISDGLGFGANTKAALITRGLSEMARLGVCLGANEKTFMGLAGLGDLLLTATDDQSRNRRFGLLLGKGKTIQEAKDEVKQVVEGSFNTSQVMKLAASHQLTLPICETVKHILDGEMTAKEAVTKLLNRPASHE